MQVIDAEHELAEQVQSWKYHNKTIAFVPTMGNLHQGHLSLINKAKELADKVIISIFVNPLQFDNNADLSAYPRTIDQDLALLMPLQCDLVFIPNAQKMYPNGMAQQTLVTVPDTDDKLCGKYRTGHFGGVATVVAKLFNMVQADIAVFGEKDYQQLLVIKKMVADLSMPIQIIPAPTLREDNGLAMSSRNQYLTEAQRQQASGIYQVLEQARNKIQQGDRNYPQLQQDAYAQLEQMGFEPEYFDIRRAEDLELAQQGDMELRLLVAAKLGKARLIDNMACNLA